MVQEAYVDLLNIYLPKICLKHDEITLICQVSTNFCNGALEFIIQGIWKNFQLQNTWGHEIYFHSQLPFEY